MDAAMLAIAQAFDAVPDGIELSAVPGFVHASVLARMPPGTPGRDGAAALARAIALAANKGRR